MDGHIDPGIRASLREATVPDSVFAVMDVATIYGAQRWLSANETWRGGKGQAISAAQSAPNVNYDRQAFNDFLHDLVLYDKIIVHGSQACAEVSLAGQINATCRVGLVEGRVTDFLGPQPEVMSSIAALIAGLASSPESALFTVTVPYLYRSGRHVDTPAMVDVAERFNLPDQLVPFALFLYRGVCYAGLANNMAKTERCSVAYVASPGRISAMEAVFSRKDVDKAKYPREAYRDLMARLGLPEQGYDFGFIESFPASSLSALTLALQNTEPHTALQRVLELRESEAAKDIRQEWTSRIFAYRDSVAIGTVLNQSIVNSHITGDVQQVIRGFASA